MTRQDKTRQDKTRQDKTRQDKTRQLVTRFLPSSINQKILYPIRRRLLYLYASTRQKLGLSLKSKLKKIRFEVHLAEHCNLNCACCNHFSPIAEDEFVDVQEFKRDMARLSELFQRNCEWIHLMGGEPLLHNEITDLIRITRENFPETKIQIITNGILLTEKGKDFWKACHDYRVQICITPYPIKLDIEKIDALAKKFLVELKRYGHTTVRDSFIVMPIDVSGGKDASRNFAMCLWGNNCCIELKHGKLFTCQFAANAFHLNKRFDTNISVTDLDYIDLYQDGITGDKILQKLTEPIPMCRYCNLENPRVENWHISKQEISEWV